ncbi:disulfide oxidoreductase [Ammoniphilus sp. 3BR4]|uniref:disulfide oxidoreductase n=1 Tax=Ammoniphilus sp. 3BR4 TaxID=3158265 RepID=UPI0034651E45
MKHHNLIRFITEYRLYLAWLVSVIALAGSLYFSEIMRFEPCKLCWFQRIFMYPLVILLGIATYKNDHGIIPYAKTLSIIGIGISLFHYAQQKVPAMQEILPCTQGVPCSGQYINWLGFITIPFLAFIGFVLIAVLLSIGKKNE